MSTFVDYKINLLVDSDFTKAAGVYRQHRCCWSELPVLFCCSLNTKPVLSGTAFLLIDSVMGYAVRSVAWSLSLRTGPFTVDVKCWMSMPAIVRCVKNGRVE